MKILKIRLKNINSLVESHTIDFTCSPLAHSPVFAIIGPTGSGKTTILDTITLALYNRIPRLGKISKTFIENTGAILSNAHNDSDSFAEIEYLSKGEIYRSKWSISRNHYGGLRDYHMEIGCVTKGNTILDVKSAKVPDVNTRLTGLDFDQFLKSILLAQGDFSRFLKAKDDERSALLEQITGTDIYRQIGKSAFDKGKEENQKLEYINNKLKDIILLNPEQEEEYSQYLQNKQDDLKVVKIELEKQRYYKECQTQCKILENKKDQLTKDIDVLKQKIKEHVDKKSIICANIEEKERILQESIEKNKLIEQARILDAQIKDCKKNALEKEENYLNIKKIKDEKEKRIVKILGNINAEKIEYDQVVHCLESYHSLETYQKDINDLKQLIEGIHSDKKFLRALIDRFEGNTYKLHLVIDDSSKLSELITQMIKEVSTIHFEDVDILKAKDYDLKNFEDYEKNKCYGLRNKLLTLNKMIVISKDYENKTNKINKCSQHIKELYGNIDIIKSQSNNNIEIEKLRLLEIEACFAREQMEAKYKDDRSKLKQGEPCYLCGSTFHPYKDRYENKIDVTKALLMEQKSKVEKLEQDTIRMEKDIVQKATEIKKEQEYYNHLEQEIKELIIDFNKYGICNISDSHIIEKYIKNIEAKIAVKQMKEIQECVLLWQKKECQHKDIAMKYNQIADDFLLQYIENQKCKVEDMVAKRDRLAKSLDMETQKHELLVKDLHEEKKKYEESHIVYEKAKAALASLEQARFDTLGDLPIDKAEKQFSIDNAISMLNISNSEFQHNDTEHKICLETLRMKTQDMINNEQVYLRLKNEIEGKEINIESLEKQFGDINQKIGELTKELELNKKRKKYYNDLVKQRNEQKKECIRWNELSDLIGDSTGKKFNKFAQSLTLSHLISFANIRLCDFTDRYTIVQKSDDTMSMAVEDRYQGGSLRAVHTLSGGESFLLSLALALGLSDLASNNTQIENLFIDEGFSTLDSETLETALSVIESFQVKCNKKVGIISHVEALKERIHPQIYITKQSGGISSLLVLD